MAKRRSKTRVGLKRPHRPPAALTTTPLPPVPQHATVPVMLRGRLYRVLEGQSGQRVVQEWESGYWCPSLVPAFELGEGRIASLQELTRHHVPASDHHPDPAWRTWQTPALTPLPNQHVKQKKA